MNYSTFLPYPYHTPSSLAVPGMPSPLNLPLYAGLAVLIANLAKRTEKANPEKPKPPVGRAERLSVINRYKL